MLLVQASQGFHAVPPLGPRYESSPGTTALLAARLAIEEQCVDTIDNGLRLASLLEDGILH